jgi:CubicO group peptidase (beta-lactamase class C family)
VAGAASASAADAPPAKGGSACANGKIRVATGCETRRTVRRKAEAIVRQAMPELGVKASILRIDTGTQPLVNAGFGNSMAGVPASPHMYFRIGSMAIPHLITLLLQLEDKGKLSLDDKLSKFRPDLPAADRITLRMLASSTSGYRDWIQGNPVFQAVLLENPFKQWTPNELLAYAFAEPLACEPGSCFHYAHTNFAVLSEVISKVSGRSVDSLMHERIFKPLGLRHTVISRLPTMPGPALHGYTGERGFYEDSTFWSPSWSIGAGTVMVAKIGDVVRSARALGTGALVSRHATRQRFAPVAAAFPPFSKSVYYALGGLVDNEWQLQNPNINGYTGIMAYLPSRDISLGVVTTQLSRSSDTGLGYASALFSKLTEYLTPERVVAYRG